MGTTSGRWWWTLTGITLIVWALQISTGVSTLAWVSVFVVAFAALGLLTVVASLSRLRVSVAGSSGGVMRWWQASGRSMFAAIAPWVIAIAIVLAFVIWSFLQVRGDPSYSTDEVAFDQYAATLALHGSNPYTHSMEPAFAAYHLSPNGATFRLDGSTVTSLSYPALSFELYLPFLALGWTTQTAVALNVVSWAVAILLLFGMLPRHIRASALVLGSLSTFIGYAVGGITDALYVPFLLGAAYYLDRSLSQRGRASWISPVLFGVAMAIKQTPWLILPFVLIAVAGESRIRHGRWGFDAAARYLAIALGVFALPNLPYAVAAPRQWFDGVMTPFLSHTVPAGQGLIGLSLFVHIGGGSLFAYSLATLVVLVALAAVYAASYPLLSAWTFVIPSLALFFAARSFGSYLVMLTPIGFLAAARHFGSWDEDGPSQPAPTIKVWRSWPVVALASMLAVTAVVAFALTSTPPLDVTISSIRTTGQLATVERIGVTVRNQSDRPLTPAFTVETAGVISAFWRVLNRETPVQPGHVGHYTLLSPNVAAQPAVSGGFSVTAFTSGPDTVSSSDVFLPSTWHVALVPDAVSRPVPVGAPVTIRAEILDTLNRRVDVSQVPIYLGQVIYDQHGLINSSAVINGSVAGHTPVSAITNSKGVATFVIRGTQLANDPVYFEANLVNFSQFYPYGYSDILLIRIGSSS
ncbi:MAG TPA: hypothetical protein VGG38_04835 [Acidimicrobiales bacterium]